MCKTRLSLSDLRDIADTTGNPARTKLLDQFAEDLLLTFLNYDEALIQTNDEGVIEFAVDESEDGLICSSFEDTINLIYKKDFYLNYEFTLEGFESCGMVQNIEIRFSKIEFNFLNNTWDMSSNSVIKERLVIKMNELESDTIFLVE